MTAEEKSSSSSKGPIPLPPWLVVLVALVIYGINVNHWVTLSSLPIVARITGWDWHPLPLSWRQTPVAPLYLLLTCPVRILPVSWQPAALNCFSALCASLTLGLLAASVRLLPHDRTREQRQREGGEYSLLSVRAAFLPALFAVLILGMQMSFWRDALAASEAMLNILVFAFLIYCLLKFRVTQNDDWLMVLALAYGLGTTDDWALIGFFPLFLFALVWIKGVNFFNLRFLRRMAAFGVSGLLLYLLVPAIASLGSDRANFFTVLHLELGAQTYGLRSVPRSIAIFAALPTLLPLVFAGIKWPSFEGELSAAGNALTKFMFRLLHVVFLLLALVMFFELRYSPSFTMAEAPIGFLTFYYIGALCIGYFSGYILLVYGKGVAQAWERRGPLLQAFNYLIVGLLWALAVGAPCWLFIQNSPHIKAGKTGLLADYSKEIIADLPAKPAIILSDDPVRLYLLEAAYRHEGRENRNVLIDTGSLPYREYISYLVSRYPTIRQWTTPPEKLRHVLPPKSLIEYMFVLSRSNSIYYLQPSFGYYFEIFYLQPRGLVYELATYPTNALMSPPPTAPEIKLNQDIWDRIAKKSFGLLTNVARLDPDAGFVSGNYSLALDLWGVELQKANHLEEANARFTQATRINPQNFIARINKDYNAQLQKGDHRALDSGDLIYKAVNMYHGPVPILKYNGPPDEPDVDLEFGRLMAEGHDLRQAAGFFERRLQLLPNDVAAELDLAKTFVDLGAADKAIDLVRKLRSNTAANNWDISRVEALAYYAKNDYKSAETLMQSALKEDPTDQNRLAILADFYRVTAYVSLRQMNAATNAMEQAKYKTESNRRFTNSLSYIEGELQILQSTGRTANAPYGLSEALLRKAEVQMMLGSFPGAIKTLSQLLDIQPSNATALLNRAVAEMQIKEYQAAKDDYRALRKLLPQQPYAVDFGLAEVAAREKDRPEEIRRLRRYLDAAPDDIPEYNQVKMRLRKLESQ